MRGFAGIVLALVLALCIGCEETQTRTQASRREPVAPSAPTGGVSMYPLSEPVPAPPMQGFVARQAPPPPDPYAAAVAYEAPALPPSPYAGLNAASLHTTAPVYSAGVYTTTTTTTTVATAPPGYAAAEIYTMPSGLTVSPAYTSSSGQFCEVTDTTESSYVIPMIDPPIQVDGRTTPYYAPPAQTPNAAPAPARTPMYAPVYTAASAPVAVMPATTAPALYTPAAAPSVVPVAGQLRLVPALDIPPGNHPNDYGPSQWFEVVRPGDGPIRLGRVSSTCVCVGVRVPNRHVAAGERALVEARLVARPPQNNLTYGLYVQVLEPVSAMLDADVTVSARR